MIETFTFCWHSESALDLGEVQHHGQLVYLTTVGQVTSRHDGGDAQLLLQHAEGQLVVVNSAGLVQGRHVAVEELKKPGLLYGTNYRGPYSSNDGLYIHTGPLQVKTSSI